MKTKPFYKPGNSTYHNILQNTDEWYELRLGLVTASNFGKVCANMGKAFGPPAVAYARLKALEIVTGELDYTENYSNGYMRRGNELEPIARDEYEINKMKNVSNGGFFSNGMLGDSPDGLVGKKGCIEIKCVIPKVHWLRIESGKYDTSYKWQIQGHLLLAGRDWCDFISYCPEFVKGKELYVYRVFRDEKMLKEMTGRLNEFCELIQEKVKILRS